MGSERERWASRAVLLCEDLLHHIFSYLPMRDSVHLQRVCKLWQTIGHKTWLKSTKLSCRDLDKTSGYNNKPNRPFFEKSVQCLGPQLTLVDVSDYAEMDDDTVDSILDKVAQFCPNLEELRIDCWHLRGNEPERLALQCPRLKKLCIENNTSDFWDYQLDFIVTNLPALKCLEISGADKIRGNFLENIPPHIETIIFTFCEKVEISRPLNLTNLKVFYVERSRHVKCSNLRASGTLEHLGLSGSFVQNLHFVKRLKQLKSLCLDELQKVNRQELELALAAIFNNCIHLEELSITYPCVSPSTFDATNMDQLFSTMDESYTTFTMSLEGISKLGKLRVLRMSHVENTFQVLMTLASRAKELEQLTVSHCEEELNAALVQLVRGCKQLAYVNVSDCPKVTAALLTSVNDEMISRNDILTFVFQDHNVWKDAKRITTSPMLHVQKNNNNCPVPRMLGRLGWQY